MEEQTKTVHQTQTCSKTKSLEFIHKFTPKSLPVCKLSKQDHTTNTSNSHIRSLWISQSQNSPVQQIDCEVNTGAGFNVLPAYKAGALLWQEWLDSLQPPMVYIKTYRGKPVSNLGSCIVYMHSGHKICKVLCQVTDTKDYFRFGREQVQQMNYIQYPEIQSPICTFTPETSFKAIAAESDKKSSSQVEKDSPRQTNEKHTKDHNKNSVAYTQSNGKECYTNTLPEKQPKNMSKLHKAGLIESIEWR